RSRALAAAGQLEPAMAIIQPVLSEVAAAGPALTPEIAGWAGGGDTADDRQKARVAGYAAAVDRARVETILSAFRVRARQGNAAEAGKLLDLLIKAGGSLENNLRPLEAVSRELAALKVLREKEGKADEAKNIGVGLGVLLDKIRTVKDLSPATLLFVAQMLQAVGKNAEALDTARKVPAPALKDWDKKKPDEIPDTERGKTLNQIRDYATAQHIAAKAMTELKQYAEAEKMLKDIIPTQWGQVRLYFRQDLAHLYEAKAAGNNDTKAANADWGLAFAEWRNLLTIHSNRLKTPPKDANMAQLRNAYADAYFEVKRCALTANLKLLKEGSPALQKTIDDVGKTFADMEKQIPAAEWEPDVQNRYHELLKAHPQVMKVYEAAGGQLFKKKAEPKP
ncbi:MAG: hypothetical protein K2V38_03200, partial [Gemmataceae bacterium]|nr:hypothetical protein [Gemmataceae bacterium]